MSWNRAIRLDRGSLGRKDGPALSYSDRRYRQMVSLSGMERLEDVAVRSGIFPCGFRAKYSGDFNPPRSAGDTIETSFGGICFCGYKGMG